MANKDWFRKESWSPVDEADFFAHLKRARTPFNKAQYLRVQALTLSDTGNLDHARTAISLAQRCLNEFPGEFWQIARCHKIIGDCNATIGKIEDAITAYMECFEAQRKFPNHLTNAPIEFAMLVVNHKLVEFYDQAVEILNEYKRSNHFPIHQFQHWGCLSIIARESGSDSDARLFAGFALDAAKQVHSGFTHHPTIGLVADRTSEFFKRIEENANLPTPMPLNTTAAKKVALDILESEKNPDDDTKCRIALRAVGVRINSIYDLVNTRGDYPAATPVLIQLLSQVETPNIKEQVVRALAVKSAKRVAESSLIKEFLTVPNTDKFHALKWVVGNTLYYLGTIDLHFDEIAEIVNDRSHGTTRQMMVSLLGKTKKNNERAEEIALELIQQEDVQGHAINALGNLRSVRATEAIEKLLSSKNEWHRREARNALKKIQKSIN